MTEGESARLCPSCGAEVIPGSDQCEDCGMDLQDLDLEPPPPANKLHATILHHHVSDLDPPVPVTARPDETIAEVVKKMIERHHGAVCIVDDNGDMMGIFTERDALMRVAAKGVDIDSQPISVVMTPEPLTIRSSENLASAFHQMSVAGFRHLPLMDGEKPVGITSVRGLLKHLAERALC